MTKLHPLAPMILSTQLLLNHLFTRVIRGLIVFRRERGDDFFEARIATQWVPEGQQF
jgi:hypothetical protein